MKKKLSVILLLGGKGSRMGSPIPKQFLFLQNKIIALYSFDFFCSFEEVDEIIVVCEEQYRHFFKHKKLKAFAIPGNRRQDSVYNGLLLTSANSTLICIHDGARPFIKKEEVKKIIESAETFGAATIGSKVKNTIKMVDKDFVEKSLNREALFEVYTPQIIKRELLFEGFDQVKKNKIDVTDDVSLVELIGKKVKIIESTSDNLKITTPTDLKIAEMIICGY